MSRFCVAAPRYLRYPQPKTPPTVPTGDERPKSPWTPSYSVTHQGNTPLASPAHSTKELEEIEQLPPPVEEKPSIVVEEAPPETEVCCFILVNSSQLTMAGLLYRLPVQSLFRSLLPDLGHLRTQ